VQRTAFNWSFEDPAQANGTEEERLEVFRKVRDEIRERIERELLSEGG
jgi:arsenate reductase